MRNSHGNTFQPQNVLGHLQIFKILFMKIKKKHKKNYNENFIFHFAVKVQNLCPFRLKKPHFPKTFCKPKLSNATCPKIGLTVSSRKKHKKNSRKIEITEKRKYKSRGKM
jgi:hypothetical protein